MGPAGKALGTARSTMSIGVWPHLGVQSEAGAVSAGSTVSFRKDAAAGETSLQWAASRLPSSHRQALLATGTATGTATGQQPTEGQQRSHSGLRASVPLSARRVRQTALRRVRARLSRQHQARLRLGG